MRASYDQKPYRRVMMEVWGGSVVPSPVDDPDSPGSLGSAISDAVRDAVSRDDTHYSLGSVLNHVLLHQTVIGLEAKDQLTHAGEGLPDIVIGSCGGGSNLGGISLPFVPDPGVQLLAVEPSSCPTLTEGTFEYDFADVAKMTPLLPMYSLGHEFMPPSIHAGGLRYHGDSPIISLLVKSGRMRAVAYPQGKVFEAAVQFARTQGTIPAPETAHAIRAVIDEALAAKEAGRGEGDPLLLFGPRAVGPGRLRRLPAWTARPGLNEPPVDSPQLTARSGRNLDREGIGKDSRGVACRLMSATSATVGLGTGERGSTPHGRSVNRRPGG